MIDAGLSDRSFIEHVLITLGVYLIAFGTRFLDIRIPTKKHPKHEWDIQCPSCGGTGERYAGCGDSIGKCDRCNGTGYL